MQTLPKNTASSNFGVSKREGHDSSSFYSRFSPPEISPNSEIAPPGQLDQIYLGDARGMDEVCDRSVALVVTSPPYFAGKEYEEALGVGHVPATYIEYLKMLEQVLAECVRKLEPGGRIAVNVANLGRKPYRSLSSDVIAILQDRLRLLLRGEVIWQKARGSSGSCAWGSFQSPANPVLRDLSERVIIASKGRFDRAIPARKRFESQLPSIVSLGRDEFMEATTDVWEIPPESATRVGHPAPFPVELPERLIHLYTYYGDLVLDPFMGSGSTAVAAIRSGRHYVGYETDPAYVRQAQERVQVEVGEEMPERISFRVPASRPGANAEEDFRLRALRDGLSARQVARGLLDLCGILEVEEDVALVPGISVSYRGLDRRGGTWLFEVCGAFTSNRPGLRRSEVLWKALGKAAVLHEVAPQTPLVLLTPETPPAGSAADLALSAVCGPGKPIAAVVRMMSEDDQHRLRSLVEGAG